MLDKPVRPEQLKAEVRRLLGRSAGTAEARGHSLSARQGQPCKLHVSYRRSKNAAGSATPACGSARPRRSESPTARPRSSPSAASAAATASASAARAPRRSWTARSEVTRLLQAAAEVAALIAPSFPAEFEECEYEKVVGMLRALGFRLCPRSRLRRRPGRPALPRASGQRRPEPVTSPRPARPWSGTSSAIIPDLVPRLAPIVSPMVAAARILHASLRAGRAGRVHRSVHRQEGRSGQRGAGRRGRRRADLRRTAPDAGGSRHPAGNRRAQRLRSAVERPGRALPDQPRAAAGGRTSRRT